GPVRSLGPGFCLAVRRATRFTQRSAHRCRSVAVQSLAQPVTDADAMFVGCIVGLSYWRDFEHCFAGRDYRRMRAQISRHDCVSLSGVGVADVLPTAERALR